MKYYLLTIVVLVGVTYCAAQVPSLGGCPKVTAMKDFDPNKYLGKWYEAERYFTIFELGGKCVSANYSLNENGTIKVLNKQINALTGARSNITGVATINPEEKSKLSVRFPNAPFDAPYWVVDTDYDNYAVVWSCTSYSIFNTRFSWILTRSQKPLLEVMQNAYKAVDSQGISRAFYMRTNQQNCPEDY